jgi:glycosyltransferase involved in cell wall biosynthesis
MKLSIVVLTYNQSEYVAQALDSVLEQKTNFNFEIIIADDGSEDGTISIIKEYKKKYPKRFITIQAEKNRGVLKNAKEAKKYIKGEYVAFIDGDDYWTYEYKLQKQIDFLDNNPEYNGIFHDAKIVHIDQDADQKLFSGKEFYSQSYNYKEIIYPSDIINRLILPTASTVLRSDFLFKKSFDLITDYYSLDWKLCCLAIKQSKFYFINQPWSVYRNHSKGVSKSNNQQFHLSHIQFLKRLLKDEYFKFYTYEIYRSIAKEYKILLESNLKNKQFNTKKIFRRYIAAEILKLWYYRIRIKTNTLH